MLKRTKRTLPRTLALVMALALLCAALLLTGCAATPEPANAGDGLDKAGDFFELSESEKQQPQETLQPENQPRQIDGQQSEKKQPATPQPEAPRKADGPTQGPTEIQVTPRVPRDIVSTATPAPVTQPPAPPQKHTEGNCYCGKTHRHHQTSGSACWCGKKHTLPQETEDAPTPQHIDNIEDCYCIRNYGW